MKKLFSLLLLLPLLSLEQTLTTKTVNLPGVGNVNVLYWDPGIKTDTLGYIFFNGAGESGQDINKLYAQAIPNLLKNNQWRPTIPVICFQTPNPWGPDRGANPTYVIACIKEALTGGYHIARNRFALTGLSYGSAYIFNYMQYAKDADYIQPLAIVAMSMEIYGTAGDSKKGTDALAGNDFRFMKVPTWFFCVPGDNFYQGQKRYYDQQVKAGNTTIKFTSYTSVPPHGGWTQQFSPILTPVSTDTWIKQQSLALQPIVVPPPVIVNKYPVVSILPVPADTNRFAILDASASYDPDGTIDSTAFNLVTGPSPARLIYSSCGLTAGVVGLVPGTYQFKFTAWDNQGAMSQVLTSVVVNPAPVTTIATIPLSFTILGTLVNKNLIVKSDGSYQIQ